MPVDAPPEPIGTPGQLKEDLKAQLLRLRDLTRRTGVLHEAQVVQLEHWPYYLWDVVEHETGVDADDRAITFIVAFKKKPGAADKKAAKRLETWVWSLLGDEWLTNVHYLVQAKGKSKAKKTKALALNVLYKGNRKTPFEPPPPPGADFKRYGLADKKAAFEVASEDLPPIVKEKP